MAMLCISVYYLSDTCYLLKTDLKNSRLEDVGDVTTLEQCRKKSSQNLASNIFTYHASTKMCYIKHVMSGTDPDRDAEGFVSGWQGCKILRMISIAYQYQKSNLFS